MKFNNANYALTVFTGLLATVMCASLAWPQRYAPKVRIAGNTSPALTSAQVLGHEDSNRVLEIVVGLKMRNKAELDALIARQSDPGLRSSETAWQDSGGGISAVFSRPTWQHGPGVPKGQFRDISDVAIDADPNTGYWTYYQGTWLSNTGGTSLGAPNWAGLWALGLEADGGNRTGLANPLLYTLGNSLAYHKEFYDTRFGSNGCVITDGCPGTGYSAGPAWDYPTGWGTPKGSNLVKAIQASFGH